MVTKSVNALADYNNKESLANRFRENRFNGVSG